MEEYCMTRTPLKKLNKTASVALVYVFLIYFSTLI